MNIRRLTHLLIAASLMIAMAGCGETTNNTSTNSTDVNTGVPTALGSTSGGASVKAPTVGRVTGATPVVMSSGTGDSVTIPAGTTLYTPIVPTPGAPPFVKLVDAATANITANMTTYKGSLPPNSTTTGLFSTNGAAIQVNVTNDLGEPVTNFAFTPPATGITVKLQTGLSPGSPFSYYSFANGVWTLEGSALVAADGSVTFTVTHLSKWAATEPLVSSASATVATAQSGPRKVVEEPAGTTATTLSELRVTTRGGTVSIPQNTELYSNNPLDKALEKSVERVIGTSIPGQPAATLTATSYLTYLPLSLGGPVFIPPGVGKQVLGGIAPAETPSKPIAVLALDLKAGTTPVLSISSAITITFNSAAPEGTPYICYATSNVISGWVPVAPGIVLANGRIDLLYRLPFFPAGIVCTDELVR